MTTKDLAAIEQGHPGALAVQNTGIMVGLIQERYPDLSRKNILLFTMQCTVMGLDPLLGEIVPTVFKNHTTNVQTLVPIITELGSGSLAARACPDAWNGPPNVELVTDPEIKEAVCGDRDAWVWKATGRRKDWEPERMYSTYGWMTQAQITKSRADRKPSGDLPGNQARVRAIKRWIAEAYPEAASQIRKAHQLLIEQNQVAKEAIDYIEAEFTLLPEVKLQAGQKAGTGKPLAKLAPRFNLQEAKQSLQPGYVPKTLDDLFGASKRYFNLSEQDTCKNLGLTDRSLIVDIPVAWQTIVAVMTGPPKDTEQTE